MEPASGLGGSINVEAVAGNVNCGSSTAGFNFTSTGVGYTVSPTLGGISTSERRKCDHQSRRTSSRRFLVPAQAPQRISAAAHLGLLPEM